jgi:hypothetical protein
MNYIQRLEDENKDLRDIDTSKMESINDILVYLASSKFGDDTTVQVSDMVTRLQQVRSIY